MPPQKLKHPLQCLGVNIPVNANVTAAAKLNLNYSDSCALRRRRRRRLRCARRGRSRRKGDLHRNKHRHGIPAQPILARQPAPREQLACRKPVTSCHHRHQTWPAMALRDDPLLFFQCPTASSARRDNFQSGDLRIRRMVSHTPMSSPSIAPRKAALAGAIRKKRATNWMNLSQLRRAVWLRRLSVLPAGS